MSDVVIRAQGLTKVYKLFAKPQYRLLDMLGLLRPGSKFYREHMALAGVDLEVRRGEKVAIIGRNGAGKSTLLKLVTRVTEPTSGTLEVTGATQALLEIGSGFHPDFTGRENVYSYLSYLGISGAEADRKVAEIVNFAEIEQYIDQPVKTYSTGMGVRLMFSAATAISPDILVIDEVLGVGDAYFAQKSFERIEALCRNRGTTLLLVTHDMYSAMRICERTVWIDKGVIVMDTGSESAIHRYEASIRDQQEQRLRALRLKNLEENLRHRTDAKNARVLYGQIRCVGNAPLDGEMPIRRISLMRDGRAVASVTPGEEDRNETLSLILDEGEGNWGNSVEIDGKRVRLLRPSGSIYHRAPFAILSDEACAAVENGSLTAAIEYKDVSKVACVVELFKQDGVTVLRGDLGNSGDALWKTGRVGLRATTHLDEPAAGLNRYGTQDFSITDVRFLSGDGRESHVFAVGDKMAIRLTYRIWDENFSEKPTIQINFLKDGVTRSHRFVLETELFDFKKSAQGTIEAIADPLLIGPGRYMVNVVVMREGGYRPDAKKKFFTANENLLDHHSRAYEIQVAKTGNVLIDDTVFIHPATWKMNGETVFQGRYLIDDRKVID